MALSCSTTSQLQVGLSCFPVAPTTCISERGVGVALLERRVGTSGFGYAEWTGKMDTQHDSCTWQGLPKDPISI